MTIATIIRYLFYLMSAISFILFGVDKLLAIANYRRISEANLLATVMYGGAAGGILAMLLFRHKIRKDRFWGVGIISLILQIGILYLAGLLPF